MIFSQFRERYKISLFFFLEEDKISGDISCAYFKSISGDTLKIPDSVMGLTFLAAGMSVPEAVSSVIVTNQGTCIKLNIIFKYIKRSIVLYLKKILTVCYFKRFYYFKKFTILYNKYLSNAILLMI